MASEFDTLSTFSDWSARLADILAQAREATDTDARLAAARRLEEFMARSSPSSPEIEGLDRLAEEAAKSLSRRALEDAVAGIKSRTASVASCAQELDSARESRSKGQFGSPSVGAALDRMTQLVESARSLARAEAGNPHDSEALRAQIGRLLEALVDLRKSFGPLPDQNRN